MGKSETAVDWATKCWWCRKKFFISEATKTKDDFVVCPGCNAWSGTEMIRRRPKIDSQRVTDPGQDRLITDLWAWVVVDPKTTLESICGIVVDGCPKMAISSNMEEALRLCGHIKALKEGSGKKIKLVRFVQSETEMEL
jgi:hypothetical protein